MIVFYMELITLTYDELNTLRKSDIFFDPSSDKIFEYRNRDGKALLVREIGQTKVTKVLKNSLKNVLKVSSDLQQYQLIGIQKDALTLFNSISGETFDLAFGDSKNMDLKDLQKSFNKGVEITAHIFEYQDMKVVIKLELGPKIQSDTKSEESSSVISNEKDLQRAKEIEERKAKKRPFSESVKPEKTIERTTKTAKKTTKKPAKAKKKTKKSK